MYFKSKKQLAIYNLDSERVEFFTKDKEFLMVFEATADELSIWRDAQEVEYEELDKSEASEF
jgi:hypothetical protein